MTTGPAVTRTGYGAGGGRSWGSGPAAGAAFDPAAAATRLERLLVLLRQVLREGGAS